MSVSEELKAIKALPAERRAQMFDRVCSRGFFVGDEIEWTTSKGTCTGHVAFAFRSTNLISIQLESGKLARFVYSDSVKLEKTGGKRVLPPYYSPDRLKAMFSLMGEDEQVFFLYHFYGCNSKAAKKTAERVGLLKDEVRTTLSAFRKKGLI